MKSGFHVVIPARYESSRLPGKPLVDLEGVPMVVRVAQNALASGAQSVTVAADDARVVNAATKAGFEALLTSTEHQSGSDRVYEVAQLKGWAASEVVVNLQGDEPLLGSDHVRRVGVALHEDPTVDVCTLRDPILEPERLNDENVVKVVTDRLDRALYFSRAPIPSGRSDSGYDRLARQGNFGWRHVGLYAYRVGALAKFVELDASELEQQELLEQLRLLDYGIAIKVLALDEIVAGGVDTPADLARVRSQLRI